MDELVERVATELGQYVYATIKPHTIMDAARAIIPIIRDAALEDAAAKCDDMRAENAANLRRADSEWKGYDSATFEAGEAIRSMKGQAHDR